MATIQEKLDLIIRTCRVATEMETRGGILRDHQPTIKVELVVPDNGDPITTDIVLEFPDKSVSSAGNWSGMGKDLDDAFNSNLLCLFYELTERQAKIQSTLKELIPLVEEAFPGATKPSDQR